MNPHAVKEGSNVIHGSRCNKFPIIEPKTYPEVIHQYGETNHHGCDTPWATELVSGGHVGKHALQTWHAHVWCWSKSWSVLRPSSEVVIAGGAADLCVSTLRCRSPSLVLPYDCDMLVESNNCSVQFFKMGTINAAEFETYFKRLS